jgi:hypothetical protein
VRRFDCAAAVGGWCSRFAGAAVVLACGDGSAYGSGSRAWPRFVGAAADQRGRPADGALINGILVLLGRYQASVDQGAVHSWHPTPAASSQNRQMCPSCTTFGLSWYIQCSSTTENATIFEFLTLPQTPLRRCTRRPRSDGAPADLAPTMHPLATSARPGHAGSRSPTVATWSFVGVRSILRPCSHWLPKTLEYERFSVACGSGGGAWPAGKPISSIGVIRRIMGRSCAREGSAPAGGVPCGDSCRGAPPARQGGGQHDGVVSRARRTRSRGGRCRRIVKCGWPFRCRRGIRGSAGR